MLVDTSKVTRQWKYRWTNTIITFRLLYYIPLAIYTAITKFCLPDLTQSMKPIMLYIKLTMRKGWDNVSCTFELILGTNIPSEIAASISSRTCFEPWGLNWSCEKEIQYRFNPGERGTPLYKVYRYVPPQRVWFLSRFGLKTGIDFEHFGLTGHLDCGNVLDSVYAKVSSREKINQFRWDLYDW